MHIKNLSQKRIIAAVGSRRFFLFVVGLLVFQAAWIALTARYPMAFDEDVWLGTIRLYADHKLPFWGAQPSGGDAFGAIARDPSYLFHYLMSFPYTLLTWFTSNEALQVLVLRAMNIGLFAWGLFLYRRLLLKTGAQAALVHICLLIFVLIPIVPMLAGQINYDNLILPLTALSLLLAVRLHESLRKADFNAKIFLQLLAVCLFASLVKYAFLPIFVAITGFMLASWWRTYRRPLRLWIVSKKSLTEFKGWPKYLLIGVILLLSVLCVERYGLNVVHYHTPVADCAQVLTYDQCQHYGPWIRDYRLEQSKSSDFSANPITYMRHWMHGMWLRSFFAVDGPTTRFQTRVPLLLPGMSVIVAAVIGLLAFVVTARRLFRRYKAPALWLFAAAIVLNVTILWVQQYQMYVQTARPVAINGRYLLPILPLVLMLTALAVNELLGSHTRLKLATASILLICFFWGGGALTYILRSNDAWYWPNQTVRTVNHAVQDVLGPVTPGHNRPTQFLP